MCAGRGKDVGTDGNAPPSGNDPFKAIFRLHCAASESLRRRWRYAHECMCVWMGGRFFFRDVAR